MKKSLVLASFLGFMLSFAPLVGATTMPGQTQYTVKVGQTVYVKNYLNMGITLEKITNTGEVLPQTDSTKPVQLKKTATIHVFSEGGCGTGGNGGVPTPGPMQMGVAQEVKDTTRCLGMPSFDNDYTFSEGQTVNALALKIKLVSISEDSVVIDTNFSGNDDGSTDDVKEIPIGRDFGDRGVTGGTINAGLGSGSGVIYPTTSITICPMGKEDCQVCANGSCKEKTVPYTEGTATAPGVRSMAISADAEIQSVDADKSSSTTPSYKVRAIRKARLFFLFPVQAELSYSVDAKTGSTTEVSKPWWNFLAW